MKLTFTTLIILTLSMVGVQIYAAPLKTPDTALKLWDQLEKEEKFLEAKTLVGSWTLIERMRIFNNFMGTGEVRAIQKYNPFGLSVQEGLQVRRLQLDYVNNSELSGTFYNFLKSSQDRCLNNGPFYVNVSNHQINFKYALCDFWIGLLSEQELSCRYEEEQNNLICVGFREDGKPWHLYVYKRTLDLPDKQQ